MCGVYGVASGVLWLDDLVTKDVDFYNNKQCSLNFLCGHCPSVSVKSKVMHDGIDFNMALEILR